MDRNLALEFVRVTEAAAIAAAEWVGRGDKIAADQAAVDAMRSRFNQIAFKGTVMIGEGKKDEAPELYAGEVVGSAAEPAFDLAIDPLECTDSVAHGRPNAMAVIAAGPAGSLLSAPDTYMEKIAAGPAAAKVIDLAASPEDNVKAAAKAIGKDVKEMTVVILDRPRHEDLVAKVRAAGARVVLITDGDVAGAIATAMPESGIDLLMGVGASAEAVLAAVALRVLRGEILCRFRPRNPQDEAELKILGLDARKVFRAADLAKGDNLSFTATGIISGPLLQGVRYEPGVAITHSVAMRSASGTVRYITTRHRAKQ